jgi:hypothetical protein
MQLKKSRMEMIDPISLYQGIPRSKRMKGFPQ